MDVYSFGVLLCEMCISELPDPKQWNKQRNRTSSLGKEWHVSRPYTALYSEGAWDETKYRRDH